MNLLLALLGCAPCGTYEIENSGLTESTGESLDMRDKETCGQGFGSWASVSSGSLGIHLRVANTSWSMELGLPWEDLHEGTMSFDDGDFVGSPCWLDGVGTCQGGINMTYGELDFLDFVATDDPCDPQAQMLMNMRWDLEFGEVGSDSYWVTAEGHDKVPVAIDFLCGTTL